MIEPSWSSAVSISSPPPTVNELLAASSSSPSSPSLNHEDSSRAFLIPASFQSSQLTIRPDSSLEELLKVLEKCKELVLNCEQCSPERSWLVRYLVEMRYRIHELQDCENSPTELGYTISGHHFKFQNQSYANRKLYCDHCSGIIRNVIQGSYICQDCEFVCHRKCVAQVVRVCPHVVASEGRLLTVICPQKGLALQGYRCAECKEDLIFKGRLNEARLCDYSGQFYCATCHWNNSIEIPARIVHNWDFEKRPVSQFAYQLLQLTKTRPLINLEEVNNKLFNFVAELDFVRKVRGDLKLIGRYLVSCQEGRSLVSGDILHMIETTNLYSVENLIEAQNGQLSSHLSKILENFRVHIIDCPVCFGKGYSCELCGNDDVIFPFDSGSIACKKCNSLFHIVCWTKKQKVCPKCRRIKLRNADTSSLSEEAEVDEDFMSVI